MDFRFPFFFFFFFSFFFLFNLKKKSTVNKSIPKALSGEGGRAYLQDKQIKKVMDVLCV